MFCDLKKYAAVVLCLALFFTAVVFALPTEAAEAFTASSSAISNGEFTVTVKFPAVKWGAFDLSVSFDPSVLQMSKKPKVETVDDDTYGISSTRPDITGANADGTYKINGVGDVEADMTSSGTRVTLYFSVKNTSAASATVSFAVNEFVSPDTSAIDSAAPAALTVTLPGSVSSNPTPPSTSTTSDTPSNPTSSTDTPSNTSSSTKSDPPASTSSSTNTNTSTKTSSTKTSSKDTSTKTDTDTGTQSDSATDSEGLTDTETNFPLSDTATDTETDVTNLISDETSGAVFSTVITATPDPEPEGISTGTIILISVGVAVVFCGVLTVIGLLRHKKEES